MNKPSRPILPDTSGTGARRHASLPDALDAVVAHYHAVAVLVVKDPEQALNLVAGFVSRVHRDAAFANGPVDENELEAAFVAYVDDVRDTCVHPVHLARNEDGTYAIAHMPLTDLMAILK
ncbi:hypothetical protein [Hyphomonas johnsonii]|uniref:Uncharacterized protein n=1 Tax=Hyphomonas johnsonii MHS-2 TaxID=1280950 RepID=A0A059FTE2_9PROT|nr:hypothetical protein [Hyphomonas johnsonii]KCZ93723.1 hypothetical protein HJO_00065 [Hyphomonas johnsonii MHS-2]